MDNYVSKIVIFAFCFCLQLASGQICSSGTSTGPNSLLKKKNSVDSDTVRTYVHTDMQYMFECCGVVEIWKLYAKNPGNISLHVWRPIGTTLQLIGQNKFSVSSKGTKTLPVQVNDRITVQYGDYIGWFSDAEMITYNTGSASDAYSLEIAYDEAFFSGGNVANWGSATVHSNRLYAVIGIATANVSPFLSDLSVPREFYQSDLHVGDSVLVAYIYDVDSHDLEYLTLTRLDAYGVYFDMNIVQNSSHASVDFVVTNIPPVGNYTIQFEAQDICFNSVHGSAEIVIKYRPLAIQSLPNVVTIYINKPGPKTLHTLVVQSDLMFGCTVETVSPAVPGGTFIIDTGVVTAVDPSVLSAPVIYSVDIACTDSQGTKDVQLLTVNAVSNTSPRVDSFIDSAMVDVYTTTINDVIHSIVVVDDEDDDVTILSYCEQNPCPFQLLNSGDVICTGALTVETQTTFIIHLALTDGNLISSEYVLNIYLQNINTAPYISNLVLGQKNTITVSETTTVGTVIFNVNGLDDNLSDVLVYTIVFDPPGGTSYFSYSMADGSLVLILSLNYTALQQSSLTVFGANVSVSDGKTSSDVHFLEIIILPAGDSSPSGNDGSNSANSGSNSVNSGTNSGIEQQSQLSVTNIVLAGVLCLFVLMSLGLCVMLMLRKTRSHVEDFNSSTAENGSTR